MKRRSWHVLSAIILTVTLLPFVPHAHAGMEAKPHLAGSPYDLIDAVNALRASYGPAPYGINPILMITAQGHADYMAATGTVSHTGSVGSTVTDRLLAAGYPLAGDLSFGGFRSENITAGSDGMSAQAAVDQWTGDSLHLNTMISSSLTEIGAGASVNAGRVYYVIDCAQPTTNGGGSADPGTSVAGATVNPGGGADIIPVVVSTPNAEGDLVHEVKAGQTLWQIAISYGVRTDEIKRLNNLSSDDIYPGTKLLVKKGVIISPTVAVQPETALTTVTSVVVPAGTATLAASAANTIPVQSSPISTSRPITWYVIGIIALALVGGGLFVWLGDVKKE